MRVFFCNVPLCGVIDYEISIREQAVWMEETRVNIGALLRVSIAPSFIYTKAPVPLLYERPW